MNWYIHLDEDRRIDGRMPEFIESREFDVTSMEFVSVQKPNIDAGCIELGWFEWPFEDDIPENFLEYGIINDKLVHLGPKPVSSEVERMLEVSKAHDSLPEMQEGLLEVAQLAANNEATLNDVMDALIELASLIEEKDNG